MLLIMNTLNQYMSVRETAQLLGISEKKVIDLIEERKLSAYRIANQFLRLKKSEVLTLQHSGRISRETTDHPFTPQERVGDFFYFNDFYLFTLLIIFVLLYVIFLIP